VGAAAAEAAMEHAAAIAVVVSVLPSVCVLSLPCGNPFPYQKALNPLNLNLSSVQALQSNR
jgi:hypothetical protein